MRIKTLPVLLALLVAPGGAFENGKLLACQHPADTRGDGGAMNENRDSEQWDRQVQVRARGPDVMSFSLGDTQHVFEKTQDGGTQLVLAREGHLEQVPKIRQHLRRIAHAFAARDFSGPVHIHGEGMPGLAELKAAPNADLTIDYRDVEAGGEIVYRASSDALRNAIHRWFDAQLADHGRDATDHMLHEHDAE